MSATCQADDPEPPLEILAYVGGQELVEVLQACRSLDSNAARLGEERFLSLPPSHADAVFVALAGASVSEDQSKLASAERDLSVQLVGSWSPAVGLRTFVKRWRDSEQLVHQRTLIELIGRLGNHRDLPLVFDVVSNLDPVYLRSPHLKSQIGRAIEGILGRDEAAIARLRREVKSPTFPPELDAYVARALTPYPGDAALSFFEVFLERTEVQVECVQALGRFAARLDSDGRTRAFEMLSRLFELAEGRVECEALTALARTRQPEAVDALLYALDQPSPRLRDRAQKGLELLFGGRCGRDARSWLIHYERERTWFDSEFQTGIANLPDMSDGEAARFLQSVARHALYRFAMSEALREFEEDLEGRKLDQLLATLRRLTLTV